MKKKETKFCPAPWYHMSTDVNGSIRPCCRFAQPQNQAEHKMPWMSSGLKEAWNGPEFQKLRQAFLNGEKPSECSWCWDEEKAGITSYRQSLIAYHPNIHKKVDFSKTVSDQPLTFDFKLSNVCNFKCRMCSPMASSLIAKEMGIKEPLWLENKIFNTSNETTFLEWLPFIEKIEMTGGEPLVNSENRVMLKHIVESGHAAHIDLQITTNCSIYSDEFAALFKQFRNVVISLSIDDIGNRLEYARHGANWEVIKSNMAKWEENFVNTVVYCTVNNFNIYYLAEFLDYMKGEIGQCVFGILHEPEYLSIKHLPNPIKEALVHHYGMIPEFEGICELLSDTSYESKLTEFIVETRKLDKIRRQSFESVFPDWNEMIYEM